MSLNTLSERHEFGTSEGATWADVARNPVSSLVDKFNLIICFIRAETLGDCGLTPQIPYEIDSLERRWPLVVLVHFRGPFRSYQLPDNHAKMVSRRDMALINSKLKDSH